MMTRILAWLVAVIFVSSSTGAMAQNDTSAAVAAAMAAVDAGDWDVAASVIEPAGALGRDIVEWHRLRAGEGSFAEYRDFLARRSDWPGLPLLRKSGERAIGAGDDPAAVIAYFKALAPQTGSGALAHAAALRATGEAKAADAEIIDAWLHLSLTAGEETAILARYADILAKYHFARQDMLLWRNAATEAARLDPLIDADQGKLADARIALIRKSNGVDALVKAVPKKLAGDPGLAYARFIWRADKGLTDSAIQMLAERSTSAKSLGNPEAWAPRRRSMVRQLMRDGKSKLAYRMASQHFLTSGDDYADLEWLAGFIALTDLKDPKAALVHFQNFQRQAATPISLGRAGYWVGRAYAALGQKDNAQAAYAFAGEFQTSYYGLLAAEKAGLKMDPVLLGRETYPDWKTAAFTKSSVFQAAMLFHKAGQPLLFTRFYRHLAESLTPVEQGQLADLALQLDEPFTAVYLAKYAADAGVVLMRPYYPLTAWADHKFAVPTELALSIARRESEFYPHAISPAGARGLMQLMPRTGKAMAARVGLPFELAKLTDDPTYNATLGSAYLRKLIDNYGPVYPLVAIGYNAGPSRVQQWSLQYGDLRNPKIDPVDWVEHIPFDETRNYVMRVMESVVIYRARLAGEVQPIRLSQELRGH